MSNIERKLLSPNRITNVILKRVTFFVENQVVTKMEKHIVFATGRTIVININGCLRLFFISVYWCSTACSTENKTFGSTKKLKCVPIL